MTKFLKNVDVTGYVSQTSVTSSLVKTDANGKLVAAVAGTDYNAPNVTSVAGTLIREIRNTTGATLTKGTIVYISGATGNKPTVSKALATGDSTSAQTFGLCQTDIANNSNGNVVVIGDITGLDTSAFTEGAQLYLSSTTAGTYTTTKQLAPAHLVYIGVVTRAHPTQGQIEVKIQNGYELDEIHDVSISSLANNHTLVWESATSLWKNKTIAAALGYTPANGANYLALTGGTLTGDLTLSGTNPRLYFTDTDNNPDYFISNTDGAFTVYDVTNSVGRFKIYSGGNAEFSNDVTTNRLTATDNANVNAIWAVSNSVNGAGIQIDNSSRASGSRFGILVGNVANGTFSIKDETNNATRFQIASTGAATFSSTLTTAGKLTVNSLAWINRPSNKVDNNGATEFGGRIEFNNAFATNLSGYVIAYYPTWNNFLITADYDGNIGGTQPNIQIGRGTIPAIHVQNSGSNLGFVGIGNTAPTVKLDIVGAKQTIISTDNGVVNITDNSGYAANSGGSLVFRGIYNSTGLTCASGFIDTLKDNGTDGNYAYAMAFGSRNSGSSTIERMRISSGGNLLIGTTTDAGFKLDVNGTGRFSGDVRNSWLVMRDDALEEYKTATNTAGVAINYVGYNSGTSYFRNFSVYNGKGSQILKITGSTGNTEFLGQVSTGALYPSYLSFYNAAAANKFIKLADDASEINAIGFSKSGSTATVWFPNGNIMVGTATDSGYKLDVNGTGRFSNQLLLGNFNGEALKFQSSTSTGSTYQRFYNSAGTARGYFGLFWSGASDYMVMDAGALEMNFGSSNKFTFTGGGPAIFSGALSTAGDVTISTGSIKLYTQQNVPGQYRYIGTEYASGNGNNKAEIRFSIDGSDTRTKITLHTANGGGQINEVLGVFASGQLKFNNYTSSSSYTGTAAGYLAFDSSGNVITVAGVASTVTAGFSLTTQGAANNTPSTPSVNAGVYAGVYAFIDLATQNENGGWIDFSKGDGGDFAGRIRYYANPERFGFHTAGGVEKITFDAGGNIVLLGGSSSSQSTLASGLVSLRFPNQYSSGYTDAGVKLYIFNSGSTIQGFTAGPAYDLQYHSSGSDSGRHAFYVANSEIIRFNKTNVTTSNASTLILGIDDNLDRTNGVSRTRLQLAPPSHTGAEWTFVTYDDSTNAYLRIGYGNGSASFQMRHDGYTTIAGNVLIHSGNIGSYAISSSGGAVSGDSYITFGPNSTWTSYLRVGGNGRTVNGDAYASMVTTNGNLHLDAGNARATYINFYAGTGGIVFGTGASGVAASMDSSGNLWKGSTIGAGTQYVYNSGTWGIGISGNAATASAVAWSGITGKPSTLSGYGIGDAVTAYYGTDINPNTQVGNYTTMTTQSGISGWTHVLSMAWQPSTVANWVSQIAFAAQSGDGAYYRTTSGNISGLAWKRLIDSGNIGSQSVNYANSAGSASSAGYSSSTGAVVHNSGRTDSAWYNVGWFASSPSPAYSADGVQIQSSTNTLKAQNLTANGNLYGGASFTAIGSNATYQVARSFGISGADYKHKYILLARVPTFGNISVNCAFRGKITSDRVNDLGMNVDQDISLSIGYGNNVYWNTEARAGNTYSLVVYNYGGTNYLALYMYTAPNYFQGTFTGMISDFGGWLDGNFLTVVELSSASHSAASYNQWTSTIMNNVVLHAGNASYAYNMNQNVRTSDGPTFNNVYNDSWFRNNNNLQGLYSPPNNTHFYAGSNFWNITSNNQGEGGLKLRTDHENTIKGYLFYNSSGFGLLNNSGDWAVRANYGGSNTGGTLYGSWQVNTATSGVSLTLGGLDNSRTYDDSNRHGMVINSLYYPHIDVNSTNNGGNYTHGPVISMTGVKTGGGFRRWGMGIANVDPGYFSIGWYDNEPNPHYGVGHSTGIGGRFVIDTAGNIWCTGDITAYGAQSDARLKTIKEKVPNALDGILKLNGYRFDWKERDVKITTFVEDIGVVAQEVADVFPELAREGEDGWMSVRYQGLTAVLIEAVKEQQKQIEELKSIINDITK